MLAFVLGAAGVFIIRNNKPVKEPEVIDDSISDGEWSIDSLKEGSITAIDYKIIYSAYIPDIETARSELRLYGIEQREKYDNDKVKKIEIQIEKKYGIYAVNLGEMDVATAKDVKRAVAYMYKNYPILEDKLTNITLGNLDTFTSGHIAITQYGEYIINEDFGKCPVVVKHEIILGAASFLNRERLLKSCSEGVENGHWPEGMDISTLVVHELGHQVLNAVSMEYYGFEHPYYVTEDTMDAFSDYIVDGLKDNQTVAKMVCEKAYERYLLEHEGESYEDFASSISGYAKGVQADGGISYSETVAESVADVYLNKKKASYASICITEILKEGLQTNS